MTVLCLDSKGERLGEKVKIRSVGDILTLINRPFKKACCLIQLTHRDRLGSIKVDYFHANLSLANSVTSEINVYAV